MSVEAMVIALHHSKAKGTAKLVLLGIANHDGDGGSWPAVSTLARYAGVDRRNVQRALDHLEGLGEIRRVRGAGGTHETADHRRPNLYRFLLTCPEGCDRSKNHRMPRMSVPIVIDPAVSEGDGVALAPHAAEASPDDASATWWGGDSAARTIHLTHTQVKETNASDRARANTGEKAALPRDAYQAAVAGVAMCGHEAIPDGSGRCVYACRQDHELRKGLSA